MGLLAVKSLSLTLGLPLFAYRSFALEPGDRIGLIAANRRGKSALLRCLAGQMEPTSGDVTRSRGATVRLVEQDVPGPLLPLTLRAAVAEVLGDPDGESWRVDVALDDLAVPEAFRDQRLDSLSGGWQWTALLVRTAVAEPDILLLDEPTNHLDLSRFGILQRWLKALPRDVAVTMASNDRAFLDGVTSISQFFTRCGLAHFCPALFAHPCFADRGRCGAGAAVRE